MVTEIRHVEIEINVSISQFHNTAEEPHPDDETDRIETGLP